MRLVLDTNVVIAALLWNGTPRRLLNRAIDHEAIELYSSPALINELGNALGYPKFSQRIARYGTTVATLVA
jgi:putative PIN family toxin of toxin-antitoxin system